MDDLDLMDESDALASLEATFLDIQVAAEALEREDGVSRAMIAPYIHLMPPTTPLASFSETPSYTNYSMSLEAMTSESRSMLVLLGIAIAAILVKVVAWVASLFLRSATTGASSQDSITNSQVIVKEDAAVVKKLAPNEKREYETAVKENARKLEDELIPGWNALTQATLERRGLVVTLERLYPLFSAVLKRTEEKLTQFFKLSQRGVADNDLAQLTYSQEFFALTVTGGLHLIQAEVKTLAKGDITTFKECAQAVADAVSSLRNEKASGRLDLAKLSEEIERGRVSVLDMDDPDNKTAARLQSIEKHLESLKNYKAPSPVGTVVTDAIKVTMVSIKDELLGVQLYYQQFAAAMRAQATFIAAVKTYNQRNHNALSKVVVQSDNDGAKDAMRTANENLNKKLK